MKQAPSVPLTHIDINSQERDGFLTSSPCPGGPSTQALTVILRLLVFGSPSRELEGSNDDQMGLVAGVLPKICATPPPNIDLDWLSS